MQNEVNSILRKKAKFLTIAQAAEFLKVSPDTLRRWENKGIVTPQRTKGGSRRYTLLDLKIAKLNKKKSRFSQIPAFLKQNYINSKRDLKIVLLTSFLWIFGLLIYHFLTPVFLRPTNPEQQVLSDQPEEQNHLKIASETTPNQVSATKVLVILDPTKGETRSTSGESTDLWRQAEVISLESDLLTRRPSGSLILQYTDSPNQYYSLQPLPQNQIPTLIKRN